MRRLIKALLIILGVIALAFVLLITIHNQWTDRINPFLEMETDYAKVEKGTQQYRNVVVYDADGEKLAYTLDYVGGYDPTREYITIEHQGQYVRRIDYITQKTYDAIVNAKQR